MNRYFFDIENGQSLRDKDGTELADQKQVRLAAVKLLGEELRDRSASFWEDPELRLTVRDDTDLILMRITVFGTLAPVSR
jgi:hypothetical protein